MRAVSDAGPLIHLSWINQLDLLSRLFDEILVPAVVRDEVLAAPAGTLGLDHLQHAFAEGRFQVRAPTTPTQFSQSIEEALDPGETEALLLALEIEADFFITDDAPARLEAARRGLAVIGTVGVLMEARDREFLPAALPLVLELRQMGQWMSDRLVQLVRDQERPG